MTISPPLATAAGPDRSTARLAFPALRRFYEWGEPVGYAMLRACFGIVMLSHGVPKLLRTSHGSMADPMAASTALIANVLKLPAPEVFAMFVALLEGLGGALLALGLGTRVIAPMIAVQMLVICYLLGPTWVWIDRGIEFPVLMLFLAVFVSFKGSGRYSADRLIGVEV
ncbi:DoxX family membrane protein [Schlegelella sp. S2-27]|uniref:DoxX family membrane protein n=1 Tax=Caldimonas mangrovi TaxID=2944811 RepID=A0ABT0YJG4_9BURK|nr:DoxX family membrane protein [Caldimonas mangrovi]MCM5678840.1 DoxX family membrane protein [Caldimonas mangrovi]